MISRRRYMGKKGLLPSRYTQIEYIESTGSQYINTEVIPYRGLTTKIDFQYTVIQNNTSIFGAWDSTGAKWVLYMATLYQNRWFYGSYTYDNYIATEWKDNIIDTLRHTIYIDGEGSISQDNTLLQTTSKISTNIAKFPIYIFGRNLNGQNNTFSKMRCYNFKMIANNTLIRNFIPCISPDNVVGMYDIVEGKFYSSPNGVAFIAGPAV